MIFRTLPGYDEKGTKTRVLRLRKEGYGIATLKGGYYKMLFIPEGPITTSNVDKVHFFILDGEKHPINGVASNVGLTHRQVIDAIRWLKDTGTNVVCGGRGKDRLCDE